MVSNVSVPFGSDGREFENCEFLPLLLGDRGGDIAFRPLPLLKLENGLCVDGVFVLAALGCLDGFDFGTLKPSFRLGLDGAELCGESGGCGVLGRLIRS